MRHLIKIMGKNDTGPWDILRIDGKKTTKKEAERFGVLCAKMIELLEGQKNTYKLNYSGEHGFIFEKPEEEVIKYILDEHNYSVSMLSLQDGI